MKCSMAWTKSPVKPNGLLYSASWSNALLQRPSSTSSYSGETPSQPGHPQAPVSFRSVIALILTSLHQAMEQLKQLKTPYPLPRVYRLEVRRISPNQCARTLGSGKSTASPGSPKRSYSQHCSFVRNSCAQKLGFSNAELLQDTDWEKVKFDPRRAAPKLPKWVWSHDPEAYAYENYDRAVESLKQGIPFEDDDRVPPNYPPGYKYEPWNIEQIMDDMRQGKSIDLGSGDWS